MHQSLQTDGRSVADHLTLDCQLFQAVEDGSSRHAFRIWEAPRPAVVLGRSNDTAAHVVEDACRADSVPVVRRFSGGGSVVLGPGCLNYAVALSLVSHPLLRDVRRSFDVILDWIAGALDLPGLTRAGTDLTLRNRKIAGSAQRRGRTALLHHGTLLYAFDAAVAERYLRHPPRQPSYREGRSHGDFLSNLPLPREVVLDRLENALSTIESAGAAGCVPAEVGIRS